MINNALFFLSRLVRISTIHIYEKPDNAVHEGYNDILIYAPTILIEGDEDDI
jgi:hypothetical protein